MISIPIRFIRSLFVLLLFAVVLTGCKKVTPLENGVLQSGLSGKAGSEQLLSLKIPPAITGLMVEATGSEHVSLELLDSEKVAISGCNALKCLKQSPPAGDYFIKLTADEDYSNVGVVAAWGGTELTTIDNDVPLTGLAASADSVILQTFYVPVNSGPLVVEASNSSVVNLEILDSTGQSITTCSAGSGCSANLNTTGLHYLKATAVVAFTELNLKVSWGGANSATMQNGVPLTGLSGNAGDTLLESFFIPANTDGFWVSKENSDYVDIEVLDPQGNPIANCDAYMCIVSQPKVGLYHVEVSFQEKVNDLSLLSIWGGKYESSLKNSVPKTGISGRENQSIYETIYVPENVAGLMTHTGVPDHGHFNAEIINTDGDNVGNCYEFCVLKTPKAGLYFQRIRLGSDVANLKMVATWSGEALSVLKNGVPMPDVNGVDEQVLLHSMYIPENTNNILVLGSQDHAGYVSILDPDGNELAACDYYQGCLIPQPAPGAYFVRTILNEDVVAMNLIAAWGGKDNTSLQNGSPKRGLFGYDGQTLLHTVYIPENTDAFRVHLLGYMPVELDIIGSDLSGVSCYGHECYMIQPAAGLYFVRSRIIGFALNFGLVSGWGGPTVSTLQNSVSAAGLWGYANEEFLHSVYIPENTESFLWDLSSVDAHSELITVNGTGVADCYGYGYDCVVQNPDAGVHFIRTRLFSDAVDAGVVASWGSATTTTLANGESILGVSGKQGELLVRSFYLPENTSGLMIHSSSASGWPLGELAIINSQGQRVSNCGTGDCFVQSPDSGVYFVQQTFIADGVDLNLVAAWGGENNTGLKNGVPLAGLSGVAGETLVTSVHIPENTSAFVLQATTDYQARINMEIVDAYGSMHSSCSQRECFLAQPEPGFYFVRIHLESDVTDISLVASWGGVSTAALGNGIPVSGLSGGAGQYVIQSVYIPEGSEGFMFQATPDAQQNLTIDIIRDNGFPAASCGGNQCFFLQPEPGLYFVRTYLESDVSELSLVASWGGEQAVSLSNGLPISGLSGNAGEYILHSIFIPESTEGLMVQASSDSLSPHRLTIIRADGSQSQDCSGNACFVVQPESGLYFVRTYIETPASNLNLVASWGGEHTSMLSNGVALSGLSGSIGQYLLQSVYIPEGMESFLVQASGKSEYYPFQLDMEILKADGTGLQNCVNECVLMQPERGLYFVRSRLYDDFTELSFVAGWGSESSAMLSNGVSLLSEFGYENEYHFVTMYFPEGVEGVSIETSNGEGWGFPIDLFNAEGQWLPYCGNVSCTLVGPEPGLYYLRIYSENLVGQYGVVAAWGGVNSATLNNGVPLEGISGLAGEVILQSVYIPENAGDVSFQLSSGAPTDLRFEVRRGDVYDDCINSCTLYQPRAGLYFLRALLDSDTSDLSVMASW